MKEKTYQIFNVLLLLNIIIFIHEFGHYFFAMIFNAKIASLNIGFGPEIISFTFNDTVFTINMLLLGGYVEIIDYEKIYILKQIVILLGGAIFGFLFIFLYYICDFMSSYKVFLPDKKQSYYLYSIDNILIKNKTMVDILHFQNKKEHNSHFKYIHLHETIIDDRQKYNFLNRLSFKNIILIFRITIDTILYSKRDTQSIDDYGNTIIAFFRYFSNKKQKNIDKIINAIAGLTLFNLLPIAPLDGGKVLSVFLNEDYKKYFYIGSLLLFVFFVTYFIILDILKLKRNNKNA